MKCTSKEQETCQVEKMSCEGCYYEGEKNMKFSIIIPVWNNEKWLEHCFQSVLDQTFKDYEVIIIDDMSTDNGMQVIRKYEQLFPRCKVILNKTRRLNGGSRNAGIAEATGDYIMCIDCDDWLVDNKVLEDIDKKLTDQDVCFLDYTVHTKDNDFVCSQHYEKMEDAFYGFTCALWTRVVKREFLLEHLQKEGTLFEDLGQHYRLVLDMKSFTYLGRVSHVWNRLNSNSISNMDQYKFYQFNFCGELYDLIKKQPEGEKKEYLKTKLKEYLKACNEMVEELWKK